MGQPLAQLQQARKALATFPQTCLTAVSSLYHSSPVGGPSQPDFLNAVVCLATNLTPCRLLCCCLALENRLGRVRQERWGPRCIDIDLLTFDQAYINWDYLQIPHPRMLERAFVLVPFIELVGSWRSPAGLDVGAEEAWALRRRQSLWLLTTNW